MRLSSLLVCVLAVFVVNVSSRLKHSGVSAAKPKSAAKRRNAGEGKEEDDDDDKGPGEAGAAMGLDAGMAGAVNPLMQALDTDGDGTISAKEIKAAVRSLKCARRQSRRDVDSRRTGPGGAAGMMGMGRCRWRWRSRRRSRAEVPAEQVEQDWAAAVVGGAGGLAERWRWWRAVARADSVSHPVMDFRRRPAS